MRMKSYGAAEEFNVYRNHENNLIVETRYDVAGMNARHERCSVVVTPSEAERMAKLLLNAARRAKEKK
jgi:hypothetical protein